jgi:hypothetical protein
MLEHIPSINGRLNILCIKYIFFFSNIDLKTGVRSPKNSIDFSCFAVLLDIFFFFCLDIYS